MTLLVRLLVALMMAAQPAALGVLTIGEPDVLAQLTDTDVAVIKERVRDTCATLWLVKTFRGQIAYDQYVHAYCASDWSNVSNVPLRRGAFVSLIRRPAEPWTVVSKDSYAQVADSGVGSDRLPDGDRDIRRPFRLIGSLDDVDLVSLVLFVRARPSNPRSNQYQHQSRVEGGWPINLVRSNADGTVTVALSRDDLSSQLVQLRKTTQGWEIVRIDLVIA